MSDLARSALSSGKQIRKRAGAYSRNLRARSVRCYYDDRPDTAPIKPRAPAIAEIPHAARPSPATVARLKAPPEPAVTHPAPAEESDDDSETASAPAAPPRALPPGARPYNIQIEAVMDKSGADEMVSRLKALGYNAQEMKVALNGQTWYRVRVGPYASAEEATAAQNQLRDKYKQAYTTSH